jgi:hypothetical protein
MPLRVGAIVEGHGEVAALRTLLQRVWFELLGGDALEVIPFRQRQESMLKAGGIEATVDAVKIALDNHPPDAFAKLVLILIDSEGDCPRDLAPRLQGRARAARSDADIACVLPHPMFETWFVAPAASLAGCNGLPAGLTTPDDPEGNGLGKAWIKRRLSRGRAYTGPVDQPRFAARMDLAACRLASPSFDKLCRELAQRLPPPAAAAPPPP